MRSCIIVEAEIRMSEKDSGLRIAEWALATLLITLLFAVMSSVLSAVTSVQKIRPEFQLANANCSMTFRSNGAMKSISLTCSRHEKH